MSEDGANIIQIFHGVERIYSQIALLLNTVDEIMGNEGWKGFKKVVSYGSSLSLDYPERWFPHILLRFYKHEANPHLLAFVSILLTDDIEEYYEVEINEPLITAGYFDYGESNEVGNNWDYWYAKCFGYYGENPDANGIVYGTKTDWEDDWNDKFHFQSFKCFGLPLISITNATDVETKIVQRLISLQNEKA